MILVLSQAAFETSTEDVLDWIGSGGGDAVRLNGEDLNGTGRISVAIDGPRFEVQMRLGERLITTKDVRVVWFRRSHQFEGLDPSEQLGDAALGTAIRKHLVDELRAARNGLLLALDGACWLTHPRELGLGKLAALSLAAEAGVDTPATLVTNDPDEVRAFARKHGRIITKCIADVDFFRYGNRLFGMYTGEVTERELALSAPHRFPSLVQEMLEKAFEIRAFYLDGEFYPMAIFSQADERTSVDFRRYRTEHPNRTVPYRLPATVLERLTAFMRAAGLSTGSVDMVRTRDGRHVFLEVNQGGQFGMVSHPCNYHLEKRVAEHLMRHDTHEHH